MRYLIFVFALFASLSLSAQRQYTPTEIANIDATSSAAGGDLYHDTTNDILYIGLMTGKLVPINNTDDQVIDRFDITGDELFISIESDGELPKSVSLTPYLDNTDEQDLSLGTQTGTLIPVNISGGNGVTIDVADNDNDSTNEIQDLNLSGNTLTVTNNGSATNINLTPYLDNTDEQDLSLGTQTGTQIPVNISGGSGVTIDVADNDNDSTNEIQDLNLSGNTLTVTNNGSATNINLAPYLDNTDAQDLSLSGNTLSISNDPNTDVDLSPYLDNTDNQDLTGATLAGSTLTIDIENGNSTSVNLSGLQDSDWFEVGGTRADDILDNIYTFGNVGINRNNPQYALHVDSGDPSSPGPWAVIEGGGNVRANTALSLYDKGTAANNEIFFDFSFNPNTSTPTTMSQIRAVTQSNFHADGAKLYLETASDDAETINTNQLVLSNDGNVGVGTDVPAAKLDVDNGTLRLSDYGGSAQTGIMSTLLAVEADGDVIEVDPTSIGSDDQNLSTNGNAGNISIEGGNTITLNVNDADADASNEIQDLSLSGNTLSLTNDASTVNLTPYLDNTDNQDLGNTASGTNRTITITGGNNTTFSIADNDNDSSNELQTFSQSGDVVTLSNGGGTFTDNHLGTQNQTLTGNRTVTQGSFDLNFDANTLFIDGSANNVGIGTNGPTERLQVDGNIVAGDEGDGTVGLTINDGQGNANLTFNHVRGVPDGSGSSARIVAPVDGNTAYLGFELASNVTAGTSVNTIEYMRLQDDGQLRLNEYGDGDFLATNGTYQLATTAAGDIIETNTMISSKIFYPPAVVIDVSATGNNQTLDLHQEYVDRFGSPMARNGTAPAALPTYSESELYYYVTDYDTSVFDNVSISETGVMTYDVISVPPGNCTFINVVFMVR